MSDDKDKKKKKRPLDDYRKEMEGVKEIDHKGEYGEEPAWLGIPQNVEEAQYYFDYPYQLHSANSPGYAKEWTKPAYDFIHDKIKNLDKKWIEQSVDSIEHQDTDFTNLDATSAAIIANTFKKGTDFANAKFDKAKLNGGTYDGCKFTNNSFTAANFGHLEFKNCIFNNVTFDNASFIKTIFTDCKFNKCSFVNTIMQKTQLYSCSIVESIFNNETWFDMSIIDTDISKSEFNKSKFSKVLIKDVKLVDSSLIKATFLRSQFRDSELSNNAWLKVGFAHSNDFIRTLIYKQNMQQCNFSDSRWEESELQDSELLKNDFSKVEIHDSDFVGLKGIGDSFATACLANCKFVDCDLVHANCTGTDFVCNTSIQSCTLDKLIYAFATMPDNFDDSQLKKTSQVQIAQHEDKDLRMGVPAVEGKIVSFKKEIKPSKVVQPDGIYIVTGTVTLEGDLTVINTEEPSMNMATLKTKKDRIEADASLTISNAIADIEVNAYDKQKLKLVTHLGIFDLTVDSFLATDEKTYLRASLSTNSEKVNHYYKNNKLEGNINVGFDLIATKQNGDSPASKPAKQEEKHQDYFFEAFVIGIVAISSLAQPQLSPAIITAGGIALAS